MTDLNKIELTPDDQRTGTAGRVLVVDDERNIRSTMQMTLRNAGPRSDATGGSGPEDQIDIPAFLRRQAN